MYRILNCILICLFSVIFCSCHKESDELYVAEEENPLEMGTLGMTDMATRVTSIGEFELGEQVLVTAHYNEDSTAVYTLQDQGALGYKWKRTSLVPLYYTRVKDCSFKVETWGGVAPISGVAPYADQSTEERYKSSDYAVGTGLLIAPDVTQPMSIKNHQLDAVLDHQFTDVRVTIDNQSAAIIDIVCVKLLNKKGTMTHTYDAGSGNYYGIVNPDSIPALKEDFIVVGYQFKSSANDTLYVEGRLPLTAFSGVSSLKGRRLNISLTFDNMKLIFDIINVEDWVETDMEGDMRDMVPIIYDPDIDLFRIYLPEGMKIFADIVNGINTTPVKGWTATTYPNKLYAANGKLMRNVSLLKYREIGWVPIGDTVSNSKQGYRGNFDGNEKRISHLKINGSLNFRGLFGAISGGASLKNVIIVGCEVNGRVYVGGLVGMMREGTRIDSCYMVSTESVLTQVTGIGTNGCIGAMVGMAHGGVKICDCGVSGGGVVKGSYNTAYYPKTGGLIGAISGTLTKEATVARCTTDLSVVMGSESVGGLIGEVSDNTNCRIINCEVNTSTLTASSKNIGGLIGLSGKGSVILNSKSTTLYITNDGSLNTGGLVGLCSSDSIVNCKAIVNELLSNGNNTGGLAAYLKTSGVVVQNCNVEIESYIRGKEYTGGLIGCTEADVEVSDCKVKSSAGADIKGIVSGTRYAGNVGGLIGYLYPNGSIKDCEVDVNAIYGSDNVGGVLGYSDSLCIISNCSATLKEVRGESGSNHGGFVGKNHSTATYSDCNVVVGTTLLTRTGKYTGGFVGLGDVCGTSDVAKFTNCTAEVADIVGNFYTGGFVGCSTGNYKFSNCTARGNVRGKNEGVGGFAGYAQSAAASGNMIYETCIHEGGSVLGMNYSYIYQNNVGGFVGIMDMGVILNGNTISGNVQGKSNVGGFVGYLGGNINKVTTLTDNIYTGGNVVSSYGVAGGFMGYLQQSSSLSSAITINNCSASAANVSALSGNVYCPFVGGFLGKGSLEGRGIVTIKESQPAVNPLYGSGSIGGFAGLLEMENTASLRIEKCNSTAAVNINTVSTSGSYAGGFLGRLVTSSTGTINIVDCSSSGNVEMTNKGNYMGGFCGELSITAGKLILDKAVATGSVSAIGSFVGGFAGKMKLYESTLTDCYSTGSVVNKQNAGNYVGGFCGILEGGKKASVLNKCYSQGAVEAIGICDGGFVGAILGNETSELQIKDCYSQGNVKATSSTVGGFAGQIYYTSNGVKVSLDNCEARGISVTSINGNEVGGFIGMAGMESEGVAYSGTLNLNKCVAKAIVNASNNYAGGFVGKINTGAGTMTYTDCEVAGSTITGSGYVGGFTGGILGSSLSGKLSITRSELSVGTVTGLYLVGGFCGSITNGEYKTVQSSSSDFYGQIDIMQCGTSAKVVATVDNYAYIGGFVGAGSADKSNGRINIAGCYAKGSVNGTYKADSLVGGFVGVLGSNMNVTACYSTGAVFSAQTSYSIAGGFAGVIHGHVESCYSSGDVRLTASANLPAYGFYGGFAASLFRTTAESEVSHCATASYVYRKSETTLTANQAFCGRSYAVWDSDGGPYAPMLPNTVGILGYTTPTNYVTIGGASDMYNIITGSTASFMIEGVMRNASASWVNGSNPSLWWE